MFLSLIYSIFISFVIADGPYHGMQTDWFVESEDSLNGMEPHFVYSVECTDYMDFQVLAFERSFVKSKQRGRLSRLVACERKEDIRHEMAPFLVSEEFVHQPRNKWPGTKDWYPPLNKPYGLQQWLEATATRNGGADEVLVIVDSDMLFVRQFPNYELDKIKGRPIAAEYGYLEIRGVGNGLVERHVVPRAPALRPDGVGVPVIIARSDLEMIVNDWIEITLSIRADKESMRLTEDQGWTAEMYGYTFAAAKHGLVHDVRVASLMLYPPMGYHSHPPNVIHYGIGYRVGSLNHWFDKHDWFTKDLLDCELDVYALQSVPPLYERRGNEYCETARGFLLATLCTNMIMDAVVAYRSAVCDAGLLATQTPAPAVHVPDFSKAGDFWRETDARWNCPLLYDQPLAKPYEADEGYYSMKQIRARQAADELAAQRNEAYEDIL